MNITYTIVDYVSSNVNLKKFLFTLLSYLGTILAFISVFKPHTYKFYILRHCIFIVMFVALVIISYDEFG